EDEFPVPGVSEPFLPDDQRRELARASGLRLVPGENALDRERYLLYACVSRATERITFSYRSSDEEGNLALPSPVIPANAEVFVPGWFDRRRRRLLADVVWEAGEAPTPRELELALARARGGSEVVDRSETRTLGERALEHVRHSEVVSGGALERFADCPVKWL